MSDKASVISAIFNLQLEILNNKELTAELKNKLIERSIEAWKEANEPQNKNKEG